MLVLRDVSLIVLALGSAMFALAALALLGGINYGLFRVRWWSLVPHWFRVARGYLAVGQYFVERVCHAIAAPFILVAQAKAYLSGIAKSHPGS